MIFFQPSFGNRSRSAFKTPAGAVHTDLQLVLRAGGSLPSCQYWSHPARILSWTTIIAFNGQEGYPYVDIRVLRLPHGSLKSSRCAPTKFAPLEPEDSQIDVARGASCSCTPIAGLIVALHPD